MRTKHLCVLIHIRIKGELGTVKLNYLRHPVIFLLAVSRRYFFCGSFLLLFCVCLCHMVVSVSCSLVVICWERVDFLALIYVMLSCGFVTLPSSLLSFRMFVVFATVWGLVSVFSVYRFFPKNQKMIFQE